MGCFTEHTRENIDAAVARWRDHCLLADESPLFGDAEVWSVANLDEFHRRFVEGYIGGEQSSSKSDQQLEDAPRGVVRLAAEAFLVYSLFAVVAIGPETKRETIRHILSLGQPPADTPGADQVAWKALDEGIGNPGGGYNFGRPVRFEVDGALLFVAPDTLVGAWRDEYRRRADGRHWLVVILQYAGGARIEIEELL